MTGIYIRVSTLQQKDNYSTDVQRQRGIAFANNKGDSYTLYDEAASAGSLDRPEFRRLLSDVERGAVDTVWVIEFSRLTRDTEDALAIRKIFVKHKAQLFVNDAELDLSSPEAVLSYNIKSSISEYERSNIAARVTRTRRRQIDDGHAAFSSLFGYDYSYSATGKKLWHVNEAEAEVVRLIFNLYGEGYSYLRIMNFLNDHGYTTKRGKKFAITTLAKILEHPEYFGKTRNTAGELIDSKTYPAILDPSVYERLQQQHIGRAKRAVLFRQAKSEVSGLLTCAHCGARFYTHRTKEYPKTAPDGVIMPRYHHQRDSTAQKACTSRPTYIRKDVVDNFLSFCYRVHIRTKNLVRIMIEQREKETVLAESDLQKQIAAVQVRFNGIEERRQKLIAGVAEGMYTLDDIRNSMDKLNTEKLEQQTALGRLDTELQIMRQDMDEMIAAFADRTIEEFEGADDQKRRRIYQSVVKSFVVDHHYLRLTFITGRVYECPIKRIPQYINAIKAIGELAVLKQERYRWDELSIENK